ncbi:FAD-dependent oxidoreductase [Streptomyces triculaminicus]|uniref:NAD(P)/FAD-dependent oxidoreductase n=1 Tax=Streptomyces triculaminicus TaxID=2816232 RepID=UPI0033FF197B
MSTRAPEEVCDAVIAGGGPAGAAAAITLARHGASVTLVDPGRAPRWKPGESLSPRARPLLARLGALERVADGSHRPCYGYQSAWGRSTLDETDFLADPHGPGWHLDRTLFDRTLADAARRAGARVRTGRVATVRRQPGHWRLTLGRETIRARYFIDATGPGARLARLAGGTVTRADRLVAIAACLPRGAVRRGVPHTSLVESTTHGWWYTAPLPGGHAIVMMMTDADLVAEQAFHAPERWWSALMATTHVRERVFHGAAIPPVRLRVARAATSCTTAAAGPGWAAVGDAATSSDPIAARGILTALATGITAADAVHADAAGNPRALETYAERVRLIHSEYLRARTICYRGEQRWDTPFWARRREETGI